MRRTGLALAVALASGLLWPSQLFAQAASAPAQPLVIELRVQGNKNLTSAAILAYAKTRAGEIFDKASVDADQRRMLQSGYFDSVSAEVTHAEGGVIITFVVVERPRAKVVKITFTGAKAFKDDELAKELPFQVGGALNEFNIEAGRAALQTKYRSAGFYYAQVSIDRSGLSLGNVGYQITEGTEVKIRKIVFEGNEFLDWFTLHTSISSTARFWPFIKGVLDDEQVQADVNTLRNLYVNEGFLDAEVDARKVFEPNKSDVQLVFHIRQGPRYRINRVIVHGNTVFRDEEIQKRFMLHQGAFFTADALTRDTKALQDMYGELGFIDAKIDSRKQFRDPTAPLPDWAKALPERKPALINLVYEIQEHDSYTVGKIDIRGNANTESRIIRRELRFIPEQVFNTVAVQESRNRLMESRLFDEVTITPTGRDPKVRDALVQVTEAKTAQFLVGVGVSSNFGLLGNISYTERNFDILGWNRPAGQAFKGAGQTLSIVAEPGTELMRFYVDWLEPHVADGPYQLSSRTFFFNRQQETYTETRYGEIIALGRQFPNKWYTELAQRVEGVNVGSLDSDAPPEVIADEGTHLMLGTKGSLVRDTTDSRWNPTTGDRLSLSYEQVYGSYTFGRAEEDYHIYRTVYTDSLDRKHVLAGKLASGQIFGGEAPVFEKFYGGGTGSVRGFKYRGISPRDNGEPIGGKFTLFAGTEYNYPLIGKMLNGVLFVDTGTVEDKYSVTQYRASVGFGFRLIIPMMGPVPMSFDFGFPISKSSEDDTQIFSFNLGWTF